MEKALYDLEKNPRFQNALPSQEDKELRFLEESIKRDLNLVEVPSKNGLRRLKAGVMLHSLHLKLALGSHGTLIVGVLRI